MTKIWAIVQLLHQTGTNIVQLLHQIFGVELSLKYCGICTFSLRKQSENQSIRLRIISYK